MSINKENQEAKRLVDYFSTKGLRSKISSAVTVDARELSDELIDAIHDRFDAVECGDALLIDIGELSSDNPDKDLLGEGIQGFEEFLLSQHL